MDVHASFLRYSNNNDKGFIVIRIRKVTTWMFMHLSEDILIIMIRGSL